MRVHEYFNRRKSQIKKEILVYIPFAVLRQGQEHGGELIFFIEDVVLIGMGVIQCRVQNFGDGFFPAS